MSQPAFHHDRIVALGRIDDRVDRGDDRALAGARPGRDVAPVDLAAEFVDLTLRIVGLALLGIELGGEADRISRAVTTSLEYLDYRINNSVAAAEHTDPAEPAGPQGFAHLRLGDRRHPRPASRGSRPRDRRPALDAPGRARRGDRLGLTDRELRDQIVTFIGAGHETTAVALAWTFYLLDRHPEADERLAPRSARPSPAARRPPPTCRGYRTPARDRGIVEDLSPAYATIRDVLADDEIGGFHIPARTMLIPALISRTGTPLSGPIPRRSTPTASSPNARLTGRDSPGIRSSGARTSASARNSP